MYHCKVCVRERRPKVYVSKYKRDMKKHVSDMHNYVSYYNFGDVPGTLGGLGSVYTQPSFFTDSK